MPTCISTKKLFARRNSATTRLYTKMRPPSAKRRKLSPGGDESENDSFASFVDSGAVKGIHEEKENGFAHRDEDEEMEVDGVGSGSDEEDGSTSSSENEPELSRTKPAPTVKQKRSADAGGSANTTTAMTGELYKSNMFKLQVDQLLQEVRPRYVVKDKGIEKALRTLKSIIEAIPPRSPTSVVEAEAALRKQENIVIPFPNPRPATNANYKLEYARPAHINPVGSFPLNLGTRAGDDIVIDLMVSMPAEIFQDKDYLNHRYFYKRAYYLSCLAAGIHANKEEKFKLSFENLHGNQLLPVLAIEFPRETHMRHSLPGKSFKVVIMPSVAEEQFPIEKLSPMKNCVRPKDTKDGVSPGEALVPTPFYNASLRTDCLITSYLKLQYTASKQFEAYKDACTLGRIWLRQRGLSGHIQSGGFGNFEWSILIALLLHGGGPNDKPAFSTGYSSYQLYKATLQFLATRDLVKAPQVVGGKIPELFDRDGTPMLFDAERGINVLFKMKSWSYKLLQYEAKASLAMLGDSTFEHFDEAFILKSDRALLRYDVVVELPWSRTPHDNANGLPELYSALVEGLSDRVKLIHVAAPEAKPWSISSKTGSSDKCSILISFVLDPANAHRLIDHGPAAEEKAEAAQFRKFWGDKAELRRFRDGSILETVIWPAKDESGNTVIRQVLSFILERQCGKKAVEAMRYGGDVDAEMLPHLSSSSTTASTTPFQPMMEAFRILEQDLRSLDDMPLQIRHLLASDPYLSYSSVDIPFIPHTTMTRPAEVILQFEGSSRWPDDLDAIQRTKMAFFLKIASLLEASSESIRARVGLENTDTPLLNQSFLDVHYIGDISSKKYGAAFRIRIHHDRELTLLERQLKGKSLSQAERQEVAFAIATHKRVFLKEPAHTQAIQTLATRFPAFSGTTRLLTHWISSHRLSNHISPYLISTLAARAFTNPAPWMPASSPQAGFYRTLLSLSRWDWRAEPWITDLGSEMRAPDVAVLNTRFEAWRKIDPALNRVVVFAGTNVDAEGNTWTDLGRPAKVVAGRLVALAKAAVGVVTEKSVHLAPGQLFHSDLGDYDFVIHLDKGLARPRKPSASRSGYKNLQLQNAQNGEDVVATASIGFRPAVLFLADFERVFGQAVLFFHNDEQGADVIAGLWNPACEERGWKLALGYSSVPRNGEKNGFVARLNKEGILSEIARLGGELVRRIEVKSQKV